MRQIPRKGDRFNAFLKADGRPDRCNPSKAARTNSAYVDAIDCHDQERTFFKNVWRFEIGFILLGGRWEEFKDTDRPVWVITKLELLEISAVPVPSKHNRSLIPPEGSVNEADTEKRAGV